MSEPQQSRPVNLQIQLAESDELGVFADLTNVWHTPNIFVMDFLTIKMPAQQAVDQNGAPIEGAPDNLATRVAARVRIPPEQVFPLIAALQKQSDAWLAEQGRSAPTTAWPPTQD